MSVYSRLVRYPDRVSRPNATAWTQAREYSVDPDQMLRSDQGLLMSTGVKIVTVNRV